MIKPAHKGGLQQVKIKKKLIQEVRKSQYRWMQCLEKKKEKKMAKEIIQLI